MPNTELIATQLYRRCDPGQFSFRTTDELEPLTDIVGQPRAIDAVQFGVDIPHHGYNIFAFGPGGTGKRSLVLQFLERKLPGHPAPEDWCYVNNFEQPHMPKAIGLPAGQGRRFRHDMAQLVDDIQVALASAFESDEYRRRHQALEEDLSQRQKVVFAELQQRAKELGLAVIPTQTGLGLVPLDETGLPMEADQVKRLPEDQRKLLAEHSETLQREGNHIFEQAPRALKDARRREKELSRDIASRAVEPLFADLRHRYDSPKLVEYLNAVKQDVVENYKRIIKLHDKAQEEKEETAQGAPSRHLSPSPQVESGPMRRYQVNLLVEHDPDQGAPLVYEDHPTFPNMTGRVDYFAHMGALVADFHMIKPGALHRANGGYLVVEAHKLLTQPLMWEALKRAISAKQVRVESPEEAMGLLRTVALEPEPIPLHVKVVLMGSAMLYQLLREYDPEFGELFKIAADFDVDMDRDAESQQLYARLLGTLVKKGSMLPFDRGAVARVIEHSSRLAGDSRKLSMHMRSIADLLYEAQHWAKLDGSSVTRVEDVEHAIAAKEHRSDRVRDRIGEEIERGTILIDTGGARIGQINGLAVYQFGDFHFGRPSRITARTRMGKGEVIDIEREVALGGALHSKGVLILSGFLFGRYGKRLPLSLSASLVFEQSYGGVDGDSASLAELCVLLSSIGEAPIKQSLAVTGSVNQHGQVQAIGGVNEKIEGFFDVCRARGLTGEQGVLIPASNVAHLMLRAGVVRAAESGQFHIYAVETVDQALELLTGFPAGEPDADGNYPPDTLNGQIHARLERFARDRRRFAAELKEPEGA